MAYYRRRNYRRPVRRRTYRKRRPIGRKWSARKRVPGVNYFKRFVDRGTINAATGTSTTFGALDFSLDQVPGYTEFQNLYDTFKLNRVKIMFLPLSNVSLTSDADAEVFRNTEFNNRLFTTIDFNDATAPTTVNELREYGTAKMSPMTRIHKRYFKPRYQDTVSGGSSQRSDWLSTDNSADVKYYGIKYALQHRTVVSESAQTLYRVECIYYMSFKQPK